MVADASQVPGDRSLTAMDKEGREDGLVWRFWLMAWLSLWRVDGWFECDDWSWLVVWGGVDGLEHDLESPEVAQKDVLGQSEGCLGLGKVEGKRLSLQCPQL